ncbi:MFS transporter [Yeosuana sp. MJ-SS3]|uniref:MFS transporter n=1 Tax=Gilvirhabdus luticola TaxID=3079858 RepID=A0ABU3UAC8_9FLAO|nr:MFS transporter [Yeosuana sp. MJ-SS3]MDU8887055.1 MFS transporter [Yeosuana sp. MJ-SS3]
MVYHNIKHQRLALSVFFFLSGFNFASWASRIPTIKSIYNLNDAELGTILLALPISSMIGLPISGWLMTKYESRIPMLASIFVLTASLVLIGFSSSIFMLVISLGLFAFFMRIFNISVNTQSINLQKIYNRRILGSLHGIWSSGGMIGVGFSTIMVKYYISMQTHMVIIAILTIILSIIAYKHVLEKDVAQTGNKLIIGKPDKYILYLGMLIFFAAVCEGGMFNWSGVYFKDVIKVEVFTYGYLTFMTCMALSRFFSDRLIDNIGMKNTYVLSAIFLASGILIAVIFPYFWPAMIGFCLVGFGTSSIFPMTYSLAGYSKKYAPGMAISILSTYGLVGFFLGPPLIGYLSNAFGLQLAFLLFVVASLSFIPISWRLFQFKKELKKG